MRSSVNQSGRSASKSSLPSTASPPRPLSRTPSVAISDYVNNVEYLGRMKAGRERIGLDGEPAGIITVEEEERARAKLASTLHPANAAKPRLTLRRAVQP